MSISITRQRKALEERYPNAFVEPYDSDVLALTDEGWHAMHRDFHFWLAEIYKAEKTDCDDFMREFNAYVKRRHRATNKKEAIGCYDLIYLVEGDPFQKHAINTVWVLRDNGEPYLSELEPQPDGGLFQCSKLEASSASLVCG